MTEQNHFSLVSIVLATYNGEIYLREQIDSLLAQTYPNIEIIAIDDGSTDGTVHILQEYSLRHTNITLHINETNLGFIKNFEKGCLLSAGTFIAPCDQDDYWLPDKIKNKMEAIGSHAMIYCDSLICDDKLQPGGKKISDIVVCKNWYSCIEFAVFARIYGHTLLFRRSLFEKAYPFVEMIPHDWWLAFTATNNGGFTFLSQPLVLYRQHNANVYGIIDRKKVLKESKTAAKTISDTKKLNLNLSKNEAIRKRMHIFYCQCPDSSRKEKNVLHKLDISYRSFSLPNNFLRMTTFFKNYNLLLASKKRSRLRQYLFCLKMFTMIK